MPYSFSICPIAPLIMCFDLRFRSMCRKIIISFLYHRIFVFKILLKYFCCSISCQYYVIQHRLNVCLKKAFFKSHSLSLITNNVKGIQSSKKRLKLLQYFKEKIGLIGQNILQVSFNADLTKFSFRIPFKNW